MNKKMIAIAMGCALWVQTGCTSKEINSALKTANKVLADANNANNGRTLTATEANGGLKEALVQGITKGTGLVSKSDGFFKNAAIKLLMPPEAVKVEQKLRALGMGNLVDDAILSMNRAAEDASGLALPIFKNAITSMSFSDVMGILRGPNDAATSFLKTATTTQLKAAFAPVVRNSLAKVGATKHWENVFNTYNKIPTVQKINPDLTDFVTQRAMDGLFLQVKTEEANIRTNPLARTSSLLKKVFDYAAKK
jgi:hypothetical protein